MILLFTFTNNFILISGAIIFVVVILVTLLSIRSKPEKLEKPTSDYLNKLLKALGGSDNIIELKREHQRLQILIVDMKSVESGILKQIGTPAFLKGKQLTLLVKHHTQEVLTFLNNHRKGVN